MKYTTLSILVPTYNNRAALLRQTLESIANQSFLPDGLEVLVSNDNSTDATDALLADLADRMPYLRWFRQAKRLGGPGNWDFLLQKATGEFVYLLCDDDAIAPDFLQAYLTAFRSDPDLDLVCSDIELRGPDFEPLTVLELGTPAGTRDGPSRVTHQLRSHHMVMSTVYRRAVLIAAGRWDEQVGSHLDCTAFCRASLRARRTHRIPRALFWFRISPGSWGHRNAMEQQEQLERWYRRKLDLLTEDARGLAPQLLPSLSTAYLAHARTRLAYFEVEFAKRRLAAPALRRAVRAVVQVFPEARFDAMTAKVLLVSWAGVGWLSALRRWSGRPDPYGSPIALFNSFPNPQE